ncbi:MAG TPA: HEAT repeat domain-containing protein [Myxococcota bacterium]|jgi:hypothetical protein
MRWQSLAWRGHPSLAIAPFVLLAAACGGGDAPPGAVADAEAPQQVAATAAPQANAAGAPIPAPGEWQLAVANGVVSVDAFQAPRRPLLEALAERAGFALELTAGELPPLTLRVEAKPLELALPLLVGELEYSAEWSSASGAHRLVKLVVGGPRALAPPDDDPSLRPGEVSDSLERALREAADDENAMSEEDALRQMHDADAELRLRAVLALASEGEGLKALVSAIESDPDPRVRAAATVGLEDSDEFAAVQALVGALDDPNAEVVVEAIDSLEFAGDASVVPALQQVLSHPDARVRDAAAKAIRLLGE